ncbi:N-6 DNA methylase [Rhizobium laguerreae]
MTGPHLKSIVKLFESCRYRHDIYTVFSDWCECAAISLSNAMDLRQREKREARYMEIIGRYERNVVETFPKIMGEVVMALEAGPQDVLGATFHELELHNTARGQFFTPYELCRMMAKITVGSAEDLQKHIDRRGYITAQEPAVGAGATIIALAEALKDAGINYQQHLHVVAVDIDPRAVHMAYIQFSLMHIPAQVIVGDTLRLEFREDWFTPAHVMGFWSGRLAADRAADLASAPPPPPLLPSPPAVLKKVKPPPKPAGLTLFDFGL